MKKEQLDEMLFASVAKTIENMAFTEVLPTDIDPPETGDECAVSLSVLEPCVGSFQMCMSRELLYFLTEALFSRPREEIQEEDLHDFLSELLNTIAGSFLSSALPDGIKFYLGLPEKIEPNTETDTDQTIQWKMSAEETIFSISVSEQLGVYLQT